MPNATPHAALRLQLVAQAYDAVDAATEDVPTEDVTTAIAKQLIACVLVARRRGFVVCAVEMELESVQAVVTGRAEVTLALRRRGASGADEGGGAFDRAAGILAEVHAACNAC